MSSTFGHEAVDGADEVESLKRRLAKAHRILTAGGMWPLTKGHVSARLPGGDRLLVLGHVHGEGRTLDTVGPADMSTVDLAGRLIEGHPHPVDERFIHTQVMTARPDVGSAVHCHCTYATALGIAGVHVLPVGNRGGIFAPQVPILEFDGQIDSPERGEMVREALGDGFALVLRNHGVVVASDTVEHACVVAFALEETARLQWIASQVGRPQPISNSEVRRVLTGVQREEYFEHVWQHYEAMDPRPETA